MSFDPPDELYPWSVLETKCSSILHGVLNKWEKLLNAREKEEIYQDFIARHAGLFLCDGERHLISISKLRLGADYVIDFAVAEENFSHGLYWELIEIKTPTTSPFTKKGQPVARLTGAIQQIHDWKRWILDHRREAERLFPGNGMRTERKPNFKFTIIIGSRDNSEAWLDKRNQLSDELRIDIRSFEYLTELFRMNSYHDRAYIFSTEAKRLNDWQMNQLANPFCKAYTDYRWRQVLRKTIGGSHFVSQSAEALLSYREHNHDLLSEFKLILNGL